VLILQNFKACPLHDVFLLFPSISRWQWHPFTLAAVEKNSGGNTLRVHIKHYGKFTGRLFRQLAAKQYLPVRVRSPVGEDAWQHSWKDYHTMLFIAGGVGISPLLCIIKDLISRQRAQQAQQDGDKVDFKCPKIILVWACRNIQEFEMMDADVLRASE
jgi:ferric-chelate reductase